MITERGVFALTADGWLLVEIAPGVDPDRDIAPMLDFPLRVAADVKSIDAVIMTGPGPLFDKWLRDSLASPIVKPGDLHERPR